MNSVNSKYIAMAMNRYYIDEGTFIYSGSHAIIGDIDSSTKVFIDINGNAYGDMMDLDYMLSEIPTAYANLMEIKDLPVLFSNDFSQEELVKMFNNKFKDLVFFSGRTKDNELVSIPVSISDLIEDIKRKNDTLSRYKEHNLESIHQQKHDEKNEDENARLGEKLGTGDEAIDRKDSLTAVEDLGEIEYIATVMNRHYVGTGAFIYDCSHIILGNIDPKTYLFTDQYGNEYANMMTLGLMESEIPLSYYNLVNVKDIDAVVDENISYKEKLTEFEKRAKDIIYFVSRIDDETPSCTPICISETIAKMQKQRAESQDNLEKCSVDSFGDVVTEKKNDDTECEYLKECCEDMEPELVELVSSIVGGKYSLDEIKRIKENLLKQAINIESVIDSIDLQIEATETGNVSIDSVEEHRTEQTIDKKSEKVEQVSNGETTKAVDSSLKMDNKIIDVEDLFEKVTRTLIGQDDAARRVIVEIARKEMHPMKKKEGILLTGKTGVGKTKLMSLIAKHLDRPFIKIDSSQLTVPGYVGKDIEEYLWQLYVKCGYNKEQAEHAIVFFDEIDKKATGRKGDVGGDGVLDVLLSFIEGTTYDACFDTKTSNNKVPIDTSNMISVFGGAYTDVYKNLKEKSIGFNGNIEPKERKATPKDFIEKGRTKDEFIGRVAVVKLNDLDFNAFKRIMLESDESAIKIQEQIFAKLGVKITFTDGYVNAIAKDADEKETGARGLNTIIDETTWEAFETVYKKSNYGKYSEVIFDEETVKNPKHYQLIKRVDEV